MRTSLIATFFNEESNIEAFLESILIQNVLPDEVVLVDGGSTDHTTSKINAFISKNRKKLKIRLFVKQGNRSVGRNEAVRKAENEIILCSDVGCTLDKNWVKEIIVPFKDKDIDVVAGYYDAKSSTVFQKCLVPYALVMPDRVDPGTFLPATRSVAFTKEIWEKIGGFEEKYSHNEDYVFARELKTKNARIVFAKDAIVHWIPRKSFKDAYIMFFRFALGDVEARIYRPKVILIFIRYIFAANLFYLLFIFRTPQYYLLFLFFVVGYFIWAIVKNYKYIHSKEAMYILPLIQLISDAAVIAGSVYGFLGHINHWFRRLVVHDKKVLLLVFLYIFLMIFLIQWGIPNSYHPFIYHMDEWHQFSALKAVITNGTTTVEGAAKMPMLHTTTTFLFLAPFVALKIINPFIIKSPFDTAELGKIFIVLRLHTLFMGLISILLVYKITKDFFKTNPFYSLFFFIISPLFISLSNYYKYDLTLLVTILLSFWMMLRYIRSATLINFVLAAFASGLSLSVKPSALPLFLLLFFVFFFFNSEKKREWSHLISGLFIYILTFVIMGVPDLFFVTTNYQEFLYSNLVTGPGESGSFLISLPPQIYFLTFQFPFLFGYGTTALLLAGGVVLLKRVVRNRNTIRLISKYEWFLLISLLLFLISLYPLKIGGTGNRALVLLPFTSIMVAIVIRKLIITSKKRMIIFSLSCIFALQAVQSLSWISLKFFSDPRQTSSTWVQENLQSGTVIGLENIPIYQYIPDITLKEFYLTQYRPTTSTRYTYQIIDSETKDLPGTIIVSNPDFDAQYRANTPKKSLVKRLEKEGYKKDQVFEPKALLGDVFFNRRDFVIANLGAVAPIPQIVIYHKGEE